MKHIKSLNEHIKEHTEFPAAHNIDDSTFISEGVVNESNKDMVNRQLNLLEKYAEAVKKNPKGNVEHFAQYVLDGIEEIRKNL